LQVWALVSPYRRTGPPRWVLGKKMVDFEVGEDCGLRV